MRVLNARDAAPFLEHVVMRDVFSHRFVNRILLHGNELPFLLSHQLTNSFAALGCAALLK